jgi:hypothetical protein
MTLELDAFGDKFRVRFTVMDFMEKKNSQQKTQLIARAWCAAPFGAQKVPIKGWKIENNTNKTRKSVMC